MRLTFVIFTLFAALVGTSASASAQEVEGRYESTNLDGSKIAAGYTIYIDVTHQNTDENGIEHYVTQSSIVKDATGEVVQTGNPGSLEWDPDTGFGDLVGSSGIDGYLWFDTGGSLVADYSNSGGNTRLWTPTLFPPFTGGVTRDDQREGLRTSFAGTDELTQAPGAA